MSSRERTRLSRKMRRWQGASLTRDNVGGKGEKKRVSRHPPPLPNLFPPPLRVLTPRLAPSHPSNPCNRAKPELASREKENDARLTSARKAVDAATERSQRMRSHYEEQLRKMQSKAGLYKL